MCNCEEKIINIGMGCCTPVLVNANLYYQKQEVDDKIAEISGVTPSDVEGIVEDYTYDKQTIDAKIAESSGLTPSDVEGIVEDYTYDKATINNKISESSGVTEEEVQDMLENYTYDKQTIDDKIAQGGTFDPTQYYNRTQTDSLLAEKLDLTAYTPTDLSNYDTKSEVNAKISNATTPINNSLTAHTANTTVHITAAERAAWNAKADIWQGTKAQYDAIQEKDPNVIYLIYNE